MTKRHISDHWFPFHEPTHLRIDNCDERRVYKNEDISGAKGGTYNMLNTSPKSSEFCLSNDVW